MPDGQTVANFDYADRLVLRQTVDGVILHTWPAADYGASSVAFSPDGQLALVGTWEGTVALWQVAEAQPVRFLQSVAAMNKFDLAVTDVAFAPDGQRVAGAINDHVFVWEAMTGDLLQVLTHTSDITQIAFAPDSQRLAVGTAEHGLYVWDVSQGTLAWSADDQRVSSVAFAPDGQTLASSADTGLIHLWHAATGTLKQTIIGPETVMHDLAFSPDGLVLAAVSTINDRVWLWGVRDGRLLNYLRGGGKGSVGFSPDGTLLLAGAEGTIMLWGVPQP